MNGMKCIRIVALASVTSQSKLAYARDCLQYAYGPLHDYVCTYKNLHAIIAVNLSIWTIGLSISPAQLVDIQPLNVSDLSGAPLVVFWYL